MKPTDPPKDYPLTDKPHPDPVEPKPSSVEGKRAILSHGDPVPHRDLTVAEREALAKRDPSTLTPAERELLARRRPLGDPDIDAVAARDRARSAQTIIVDDRTYAIVHQVDGRTTVIARELEGDAAVLEQLRAQVQLDARDLRPATPAQLEVLTVIVARMRALAAQLAMLCASRDVPLPQIPTLPAPPHVPPPRA